MFLGHFSQNRCRFTSLLNYQRHGENAPVQFVLHYFTEFLDSKGWSNELRRCSRVKSFSFSTGIVLMSGNVIEDGVTITNAQLLSYEMQYFYGGEHCQLVKDFNMCPGSFDYEDVVKSISNSLLWEQSKTLKWTPQRSIYNCIKWLIQCIQLKSSKVYSNKTSDLKCQKHAFDSGHISEFIKMQCKGINTKICYCQGLCSVFGHEILTWFSDRYQLHLQIFILFPSILIFTARCIFEFFLLSAKFLMCFSNLSSFFDDLGAPVLLVLFFGHSPSSSPNIVPSTFHLGLTT